MRRYLCKEAAELHNRYKAMLINDFERERMSCGLSGVLDVSDDNEHGQRKLFDNTSWMQLNAHFMNMYHLKTLDVEKKHMDVWEYNTTTYKKFMAKKYINGICSLSKPPMKETTRCIACFMMSWRPWVNKNTFYN